MTNVPVTKLASIEFAKILVIVEQAQNVSFLITDQFADAPKEPLVIPRLLASILDANPIQNVLTEKPV